MKFVTVLGASITVLAVLAQGVRADDICIGGDGSCSSEGTCSPGKLNDGKTAPTATFSFDYDGSTPSSSDQGTLSFTVENTSEDGGDSCGGGETKHPFIIGSYFNATSNVTNVSLLSATDGDGIDRTGSFSLQFSNPRSIRVDGLGFYSVCIEGPRIISATATTFNGSAVRSPVEFELLVSGPSGSITTSSFTTVESTSSNGSVQSTGVAKFQGGGCNGDFSAFISNGDCEITSCDPPSITCPSQTVMFDCDGPDGTIVDFEVTATSPCYDANELTITCEPIEPGDLVPAGTNVIITCTVTDPEGNTDTCDFRLKVWDFTPPTVDCPDDMFVECTSTGGAIVEYVVTTDDICCPDQVDLECDPPSGSFFPIGTTTVTCVATDWDNKVAECSFEITVEDNNPPVINCPDDIKRTCEGTVDFNVTASDTCDAGVDIECTPPSGSTFPVGTTTVTCTATDDSGNTAMCSFDVVVNDNPPTITCPSEDIVVECTNPGGEVITYEVTAGDDCDGSVDVVCTPPSGSTFPIGTTVVSCVATDSNGGTASCTFNVTVEDTTDPVIDCSGDIQQDCAGVVDFEVAASDICDDSVVVECVPPSGSNFSVGTTVVTCTATDDAGNTAECTFTVTITDDPPTITCPDDIEMACVGPVDFVVTATDVCDPNVMIECVPPPGSNFPVGTTTVNCTATDDAGNTATCSFTVTITDDPPVINCPDDITLECTGPNGTQVDFEVTATDDCGEVTIECSAEPGLFPCGDFLVDCVATDESGNTSECSFTIRVTDTTPPDIQCPEDIRVEGSDKPVTVDFEVIATDLCDPDAVVSCNPPPGSVFNPGVTTVVCTATDNKGNMSMCDFEVEVQMYINFDENINSTLPDFTFITDEYLPLGILINGVSDTGNPGVLARRTGAPGSTREDLIPTTGLNYAQTWSGGDDSDSGKITFEFFDPDTGTATTSSFVQLTFMDIESSGLGVGGEGRTRLKAYDEDGNLLDRVLVPFGSNGNHFVATIGTPGGPLRIAKAEAVIGNPVDSGGVDEFCYLPVLSPITVAITGDPIVYAGEELSINIFVRNNRSEDLDVIYKMRGTPKRKKPGNTIEGPVPMILPSGFSSMANPEQATIPIPANKPRIWNRNAFIIVSYKDAATNEFIGNGTFMFRIKPPRE